MPNPNNTWREIGDLDLMGCPICLEKYYEATSNELKPMAYPCGKYFTQLGCSYLLATCLLPLKMGHSSSCSSSPSSFPPVTPNSGHISHVKCALETHQSLGRGVKPHCPQCRHPYNVIEDLRVLYPDTGGLSLRKVEHLDPHLSAIMSVEAQEELINQLTDFQEHLFDYSMAVRNVRMEVVVEEGIKVRGLYKGYAEIDQADRKMRLNVSVYEWRRDRLKSGRALFLL